MDTRNLADVLARCPPAHRYKVKRFLADEADVPDPWYEPRRQTRFGVCLRGEPLEASKYDKDQGFEDVLDLCEAASTRLLNSL